MSRTSGELVEEWKKHEKDDVDIPDDEMKRYLSKFEYSLLQWAEGTLENARVQFTDLEWFELMLLEHRVIITLFKELVLTRKALHRYMGESVQ